MNKITVLWFTTTSCNAAKKLQNQTVVGGWLTSLENELKKIENIELHVCFYHNEKMDSFIFENVTYHPIYRSQPHNKIKALIQRYLNLIFPAKENIGNLLDIINNVNPNIIHIHGTESNFGLIQKYTPIPCILSIQSIISPYVEKFFSGIPQNIANKYETIFSKLILSSAKRTYNNFNKTGIRERDIYSYTKFIMGRTTWDYNISRILSPNSIYFEGNEIMRPSFYTNKWKKEEPSEIFHIVTTMSNGLYKGLETVVRTAQILNKTKFKFKWIIIGQKETDSNSILIKRWLKCNFNEENIQLVGKKKENELIEILLQSDLFCQVSHIENSPNSLCEAMLLGMPIIASMVGGSDTLLENKMEGILIQDGDPYSLAGAIYQTKQNYKRAIEMGSNAYKKASIRHNPKKIVNEVLHAYQYILQQ